MNIVLFGDSITDMGRAREEFFNPFQYGVGYSNFVAGALLSENAKKYKIYNMGISGNRIVDLYARIKCDVWNKEPDVISILIGINDIWHEISNKNGVDIERYERFYQMIIDDTKVRFPSVKFMLLEPFVLHGSATDERADDFFKVKDYAKVVKKIAEKNGELFLPLQDLLEKKAVELGNENILYDGVHPNTAGAKIIADAWVKLFKEKVDK